MNISIHPSRDYAQKPPRNSDRGLPHPLEARLPRQQRSYRLPIELMARLTESLDVRTIRAVEKGLYGGRPVPILWSHLTKPVMAAIGSALPRPYPSLSQLCQRGIPPQALEKLSPLARYEVTRALLPGAENTVLYEQLKYTWETIREEAYCLVGSTPVLVTGFVNNPSETRLRDQLQRTKNILVALRPMALLRDSEAGTSCVVMLDSFVNYLDGILTQQFQGNVLSALVGMTTTFGNYFR